MIRISNIRMPLDYQPEQLEKKVCKLLRTRSGIQAIHLVKQSVGARKKSDLHFVLSVDVEAEGEGALVKGAKSNQIKLVVRKPYQFPPVQRTSTQPPVVVGMGPAGLFAALYLARNGIPSIVLERGRTGGGTRPQRSGAVLGAPARWTQPPTSSSARAVQAPSPTAS